MNTTFRLSGSNRKNRVDNICSKLFGKSRVEFCCKRCVGDVDQGSAVQWNRFFEAIQKLVMVVASFLG